jgi:hypothetical protein
MARPALQFRHQSPSPSSPPPPTARPHRVPASRPQGLFNLLLPVIFIGSVGLLHIYSLARLSELTYEHARLERLITEQGIRQAELRQQCKQAVALPVLEAYSQQHGLVDAGQPRLVRAGILPAPQSHLNLMSQRGDTPGEAAPADEELPAANPLTPGSP